MNSACKKRKAEGVDLKNHPLVFLLAPARGAPRRACAVELRLARAATQVGEDARERGAHPGWVGGDGGGEVEV